MSSVIEKPEARSLKPLLLWLALVVVPMTEG